MAFKDSLVGKATYGIGRGIASVPGQFWGGVAITTGALASGYYALFHKTGAGQTLASAISPMDLVQVGAAAAATWMGVKAKNLVDLIIPAAAFGADNIFRKITDSGYTWEQLGADAKPEVIGVIGLYLLGRAVKKVARI